MKIRALRKVSLSCLSLLASVSVSLHAWADTSEESPPEAVEELQVLELQTQEGERLRTLTFTPGTQIRIGSAFEPGARASILWASNVQQPALTRIVDCATVLVDARSPSAHVKKMPKAFQVPGSVTFIVSETQSSKITLAKSQGAVFVDNCENSQEIAKASLVLDNPREGCVGEYTLGSKHYCIQDSGKLEPIG